MKIKKNLKICQKKKEKIERKNTIKVKKIEEIESEDKYIKKQAIKEDEKSSRVCRKRREKN